MKKIMSIIAVIFILLLLLGCPEATEEYSFSSKSTGSGSVVKSVEFTVVGTHLWTIPDNAVGDLTITIIGGGGGGGGGGFANGGGGGGGAGENLIYTIPVQQVNISQLEVGRGGTGGVVEVRGSTGTSSFFRYAGIEFSARPGGYGYHGDNATLRRGQGGGGYPAGVGGGITHNGGKGGNNGRGCGPEVGSNNTGIAAPNNSGGGGSGGGNGRSGGNGGSGYVRIDYTVVE